MTQAVQASQPPGAHRRLFGRTQPMSCTFFIRFRSSLFALLLLRSLQTWPDCPIDVTIRAGEQVDGEGKPPRRALAGGRVSVSAAASADRPRCGRGAALPPHSISGALPPQRLHLAQRAGTRLPGRYDIFICVRVSCVCRVSHVFLFACDTRSSTARCVLA